jgi:hypothetical protein
MGEIFQNNVQRIYKCILFHNPSSFPLRSLQYPEMFQTGEALQLTHIVAVNSGCNDRLHGVGRVGSSRACCGDT